MIQEDEMFLRLFQAQEDVIMVRNIIIVLILVAIGVPAWQIGGIMLERKQVRYAIQAHANSIKRYQNEEVVKGNLKKELEVRNLPTVFNFEQLEMQKVKIRYGYRAAATVFNFTYYQVSEEMEAVTEEGAFAEDKGEY
jgi:Tfp pilus assembly protein PilE